MGMVGSLSSSIFEASFDIYQLSIWFTESTTLRKMPSTIIEVAADVTESPRSGEGGVERGDGGRMGREVAESCVDGVIIEMVSAYCKRFYGTKPELAARRIEAIGYQVGHQLIERLPSNSSLVANFHIFPSSDLL
ncbi:hypothetical protein BHM03_00040643 [Ensete ventricosum]|nr:hypothetical protein BHM03_00040643 [Ensete ventricosum]